MARQRDIAGYIKVTEERSRFSPNWRVYILSRHTGDEDRRL